MGKKASAYHEDQPFLEKLKHGYHPMTEGVRWSENYADTIESVWSKIPSPLRTMLATLVVFVMGSAIQGKRTLLLLHIIISMSGVTIGLRLNIFIMMPPHTNSSNIIATHRYQTFQAP